MNKKLDKVRENIRKTEKQMRELDEYLKTLRLQEKQLEDEEIIKQIRSLNTKRWEMSWMWLRRVQNMKLQNRKYRIITKERVWNMVNKKMRKVFMVLTLLFNDDTWQFHECLCLCG